jgi:hypothetical protein
MLFLSVEKDMELLAQVWFVVSNVRQIVRRLGKEVFARYLLRQQLSVVRHCRLEWMRCIVADVAAGLWNL